MSHVFFSYAHKDTEKAAQVINRLRAGGFVVWQDTSDIRATEAWITRISSGVAGAAVVVVLWSEHAKNSEWVLKEIHMAISQNKPITALMVDKTPLLPELSTSQGIPPELGLDAAISTLQGHLIRLYPTIKRRRLDFALGKKLGEQTISNQVPMDDKTTLVWVPLLESGYCRADVAGTADTIIQVPSVLQVCLQTTRETTYSFVPDVYRWVCEIQQHGGDLTFNAVCITSPINTEGKYYLDNDNSAPWQDVIDTTYAAVDVFSRAKRPTLQIFNLAPAALMAGIGLRFYRFWHLQLYNLAGGTYKRVLEFLPDEQ